MSLISFHFVRMKLQRKTSILMCTLCILISFAKFVRGEDYKGLLDIIKVCWDNGGLPACTDDREGFVTVQCEWGGEDWDLDSKVTYTKCPIDQECVCYRKCCHADLICQDKDEREPHFPKTGVLSYTGSTIGWDLDEFKENQWTGKTVLDENGRFYTEYRDYRHGPGWIQRFLIALPSGDGYRKITGWLGNTKCWMEDIDQQPWLYRNYRGRPIQGNKKIFEGNENGKYIQRWWNIDYERWWAAEGTSAGQYDNVTYTYNYEPDNNLAIPLQYYHFFQYEDSLRMDIKNYVYRPTIEDEGVFDVNRYCETFNIGNGGVSIDDLPN